MVFSSNAAQIATASADQTARLWTADRGTERLRVAHDGAVHAVALSADGHRMASAGGTTVVVSNTDNGTPILKLAHGGPVFAVAFSPDGGYVMTGGDDRPRGLRTPEPERVDRQRWAHVGASESLQARLPRFVNRWRVAGVELGARRTAGVCPARCGWSQTCSR